MKFCCGVLVLVLMILASEAKKRDAVVRIRKVKDNTAKLIWRPNPKAVKYQAYWQPANMADISAEKYGSTFKQKSSETKRIKRKLRNLPSGWDLSTYIIPYDKDDKQLKIIWGDEDFHTTGEHDDSYSPTGGIWFEDGSPEGGAGPLHLPAPAPETER